MDLHVNPQFLHLWLHTSYWSFAAAVVEISFSAVNILFLTRSANLPIEAESSPTSLVSIGGNTIYKVVSF